MTTRNFIAGLVAILLAAAPPSPGFMPLQAATVTPQAHASPTVVFDNLTDSPIFVYVDDAYAVRCESYARCTVTIPRSGEIQVVGRCMCDTWGPYQLKLAAGKSTTCRFTEMGRRTWGVTSVAVAPQP